MADKPIHAAHRQRMMQKFLMHGMDTLTDIEVLEMLLYFSIPRANTNEAAHHLKMRFGSLHGVFEAPIADLEQVQGVGPRSAQLIHFCYRLFHRYRKDRREYEQTGAGLTTLEHFAHYFVPQFEGVAVETLIAAYLDNKNRVLQCEIIAVGAANTVTMDCRQVVKSALACNAAGVALAHNHPGGTATPSTQDIAMTDRVREVMQSISVQLIEHFVVAGNRCYAIGGRKSMVYKEDF